MATPDTLGVVPAPLSGLTITASSTASGWPASNLVDGIVAGATNSWSASAAVPGWVQAQLSSAAVSTAYTIIARTDAPNSCASDWTFEGSNDGSSWTTLDTRTGQTWNAGQRRQYSFSNSTSYLYYKLNITATQGGGATWPSFTEWEVCSGTASSLLDWWKADAITGVSDGASLAASSIPDSSGHGHTFNASARTGIYRASSGPNSKPFIDGSTTSGFVYSGTAVAAPTHDFTYFAVLKTSSSAIQSVIGSVNNGGAQFRINNYKLEIDQDAINTLATSNLYLTSAAWMIVILSYERDTGTYHVNVHGVTETISTSANRNFTSPGSVLSLGGYQGSTTTCWQGGIAEVGRYTTVLSGSDKNDLYDYLQVKYFPNASAIQAESIYAEALMINGAMGVQAESVYAEALMTNGGIGVQAESVYAEALTTAGAMGVQAESIYAEVMVFVLAAQVESVYIESMLTGTPPSQIESVYVESMLTTTPPSQIESVYVESMLTTTPPMQVEGVYLEVLLLQLPVVNFRGWGLPVAD